MMLAYFDRVFDGRELEGARLSAPAHAEQLEADVREHQGPVPRQPAARVPGHASACSGSTSNRRSRWTTTGRHGVLVSRRGEQEANEATAQMRAFRAGSQARRPAPASIRCASFPATPTVVMQTAVAEPDRAAAVERAGDAPDRAARRAEFRPRLDRFRLCRRPAGNDASGGCARPICSARPGSSRSTTARRCSCRRPASPATTSATASSRWAGAMSPTTPHMVTETAIRGFYQHYRAVMGL